MDLNNKYRIENKKIGSGGFSEVYLGLDKSLNIKIAIKKINLKQKNIVLDKLNIEIEIMKKMKHPNIITFYDVIKTEDYWYIIMEYCNKGTLEDVIKYNKEIKNKKEINAYYYLNQLKNAINYIKDMGYIHRDLKPLNILLKTNNINDINDLNYDHTENIILKLADFGLAIENDNSLMDTICGSPYYMAPELFTEKEYDNKVDLWSFGIIMYQLLFGENPNKASSLEELINNIKLKDINLKIDESITTNCYNLLQHLLIKSSKKRINWNDLFNHKWFFYWDSIYNSKDDIISSSYPQEFKQSNNESPLGYSNLSKMKLNYMWKYQTPSSYPSLNLRNSNLSQSSEKSNEYSKLDLSNCIVSDYIGKVSTPISIKKK